jgi:parvulin-like peptidyl-prolyl isomerase
MMDELMEATGRNAVSDEAVRKAYDEYVARNPPEPALHLRAILFKFPKAADQAAVAAAQARAEEAIKLIAGGEDFRAAAVKLSEDPGAKIDSGDLGFVTRTQMGEEYAEVAFKLAEGEVSRPIKTEFGWHVIRVEGERISKPAEFDEMRAALTAYLSPNAHLQLRALLRPAMPLERLDQAAAAPGDPGK